MFETLNNACKVKEIRSKILITLLFVLIYRLGCYIPVPGIGGFLISETDLSNVSYLNIMSMMSGGALAQGTWFAMGIGPYINASIIIQLLTVAIPALERAFRNPSSICDNGTFVRYSSGLDFPSNSSSKYSRISII